MKVLNGGYSHIYANLTKKEYLNPVTFGELPQGRSIVNNHSGVMYAFSILILPPQIHVDPKNGLSETDFPQIGVTINNGQKIHHPIGSWYGDTVVMASSGERCSDLLTPYYMKDFVIPKYSRWNVHKLATTFFKDISSMMVGVVKELEKDNPDHPIHHINLRHRAGVEQFGDPSMFRGIQPTVSRTINVNVINDSDPHKPKQRKYLAD